MKGMVFNRLDTKDCPCKNCKDRYVGCHVKCLSYIDWKQRREAKLQDIKTQNDINNTLFGNKLNRDKMIVQEGGIRYGRNGNDTR